MPLSFYKNEFFRSEGNLWFKLPCAHYEGAGCPIYNQRFATCRRYRCKLLKLHDSGGITFADAKQIIAQAKALIAGVKQRNRGCATKEQRSALLREQRAALADASDEKRQEIGKRIVEIVALSRFLELHFHSPKPRPDPSQDATAS
jgi:hypothetical protein